MYLEKKCGKEEDNHPGRAAHNHSFFVDLRVTTEIFVAANRKPCGQSNSALFA
jgi:hypothetical protein